MDHIDEVEGDRLNPRALAQRKAVEELVYRELQTEAPEEIWEKLRGGLAAPKKTPWFRHAPYLVALAAVLVVTLAVLGLIVMRPAHPHEYAMRMPSAGSKGAPDPTGSLSLIASNPIVRVDFARSELILPFVDGGTWTSTLVLSANPSPEWGPGWIEYEVGQKVSGTTQLLNELTGRLLVKVLSSEFQTKPITRKSVKSLVLRLNIHNRSNHEVEIFRVFDTP